MSNRFNYDPWRESPPEAELTDERVDMELRSYGLDPTEIVNQLADKVRDLYAEYQASGKPIPPMLQDCYNQLKNKPKHVHKYEVFSYDEEAGFGYARCGCGDWKTI